MVCVAGESVEFVGFEVVEGALLEAPAAPGTPIAATLDLVTASGDRQRWQARGVAVDFDLTYGLPRQTEAGLGAKLFWVGGGGGGGECWWVRGSPWRGHGAGRWQPAQRRTAQRLPAASWLSR